MSPRYERLVLRNNHFDNAVVSWKITGHKEQTDCFSALYIKLASTPVHWTGRMEISQFLSIASTHIAM